MNDVHVEKAKQEEQFMVLVNNLPDLVSLLDKDFRYIFVNKTVLKLTNSSSDFFVGKTIYDLGFPEQFIKDHEKHLIYVFEKGVTSTFTTVSELPQVGLGLRTYQITLVPIMDKDGKRVETVLNTAKDITEKQEVERELNDHIHELQELSGNLVNKNRQLQDFAHIVSHNLRSPMSNLISLMGIYENEKTQEQKDFLIKKIAEVTRSFSQTIDELTEVVKIRQDKGIEFHPNKFEDTVEHIKTILNTQIQLSNTTIICNFKECDSIRYPKVYLESILQNLITNSIKYRSKDRALIIEMTSKKLDDGILFICKDNGMGIDLKRFGDKIFGMNKTFHLNLDSRGMGLFITRNQIESLGGSISVESEPEKGAEFSIVFG